MPVSWGILLWSGLVATTLATSLLWVAFSLGLTVFSPATQLGCVFRRDPHSPATEAVGVAVLFLLGTTLVPGIYFWILLRWAGSVSWEGGAVVGGLHGLLTVLALPVLGGLSACIRNGRLPRPGLLGLRWGKPTPAVVLLGHVVFGAVLAAVGAALQRPAAFPL